MSADVADGPARLVYVLVECAPGATAAEVAALCRQLETLPGISGAAVVPGGPLRLAEVIARLRTLGLAAEEAEEGER